jgi:hypothetical protein
LDEWQIQADEPHDQTTLPYDEYDQLERHPADFVGAYNFGRQLKALRHLRRWIIEL